MKSGACDICGKPTPVDKLRTLTWVSTPEMRESCQPCVDALEKYNHQIEKRLETARRRLVKKRAEKMRAGRRVRSSWSERMMILAGLVDAAADRPRDPTH